MDKKGIYKIGIAVVGMALFAGLFLFLFLPFLSSQASPQPQNISIRVLNPKSFPVVGGNWKVDFVTSGTANLTIKAVNGTHFGKSIELKSIECGSQSINFTWIDNDTILIPNYSCNSTSLEVSHVLTSGNHTLEFDFGNAVSYAHNFASRLNWFTQSGEVTMNAQTVTVNLPTEVNTSRAFILVTRRTTTSYDDPDKSGIYATFVNGTQFTLNQYNPTTFGAQIVWQVIEGGSIYVQSGVQTYATSDTSFDIPINSVNTSRTAVFMNFGSCSSSTVSNNYQIFWTGNVSSSTNLHIQRDGAGSCAGDVSYYVVEFNGGSTVQSGEISSLGTLSYAMFNPVNTSDTWFYFTQADNSGANGLNDASIIALPYNNTAYQVSRLANGGNVRIQWYAISTPGATTQKGMTNLNTNNNVNTTISSVVLNRTFVVNSFNDSGGGTTFANTMGTAQVVDSTTLNQQRGTTSQNNAQAYEVVQLPYNPPYVLWNQSTLDLGSQPIENGNLTGVVQVYSFLTNNNTHVSCTSGDCSDISTNFTSMNLSDGDYENVYFTCLNTTVGALSATFNVTSLQNTKNSYITVSCGFDDIHAPTGNLLTPLNGAYVNSVNQNLTLEAFDNYALQYATLQVWNSTGSLINQTSRPISGTDAVYGIVYNFPYNGVFTWGYRLNDTSGNTNYTSNNTLTVDTVNPSLSFASGTSPNDTNTTDTYIYVNTSFSDLNFANVTYSVYDSNNNPVNITTYYSQVKNINWTGLPDGVYFYNVSVFDLADNSNSTEVRQIRIDTTPPVINIVKPQPIEYLTNVSLPLNVSVTDSGVGLSACEWNLDGDANQTIPCNQNITFNTSTGSHTLYFYSNDSLGNLATANVTFQVSLGGISVRLISPDDGTYLNYNNINFTLSTKSNLPVDTCILYGNWTGVWGANKSVSGFFPWYNSNWIERKLIQVPAGRVSQNLTNFPMLVDLYDNNLHDLARSDGYDILFTDLEGNKLPHQIELFNQSYNSTTAHLVAWVSVNLSSIKNNSFYMYYDNPSASNQQDVAGVWGPDYISVYHLSENPSAAAPQFLDSKNGNNGTSIALSSSDQIPGQIDGSVNFSGSDGIDLGTGGSVRGLTEYTISAWVNPSSIGTGRQDIYEETTPNTAQSRAKLLLDAGAFALEGRSADTDSYTTWVTSTLTPSTGNWYYVTGIFNSVTDTHQIFVNGVLTNNTVTASTISNTVPGTSILIGSHPAGGEDWLGQIDELRVSDTARGLDWVNASYQNQLNPSGFYSINSQQDYYNPFNTTISSDGSYIWNVWCNQTDGLSSFSIVNNTFTIDTVNPLISYAQGTRPNDTYINSTSIFVNTTASDLNFANITFNLYNGTNYNLYSDTFTDSTRNDTWLYLPEGTYYYNVTIYDLAGNENSTATRWITLDTTAPNGTLLTPANDTHTNNSVQNLTVNATDNIDLKNATLNVYNSSGNLINATTVLVSGTQAVVGVVYEFLYDGVFQWFYRIFDQAGNMFVTDNNTISVDTTKPLVSYSGGTAGNNTKYERNWIYVNTTSSDLNFANITFDLYNSSSLVNETTYTSQGINEINWTNLSSANVTYYYNVTVEDTYGNFNYTKTRYLELIDIHAPKLTLITPKNQTYSINESLPLSFSAIDPNLDSCWYNLDQGANQTIACNQDTTFSTSDMQEHTLYLYANDTLGQLSSKNVSFLVNTSYIPAGGYYVQRGSVGVNGQSIVPIDEVNPANSFILLDTVSSSSAPSVLQVIANFSDPSDLSFWNYGGGTANTEWEVVKGPDIKVQRDQQTYTSTASSILVPISAVNLSSSFIIVDNRLNTGTTNQYQRGLWRGTFVNSTYIQLQRGTTGNAGQVSWQVVDWKGTKVQNGTSTLTGGSTTTSLGSSIIRNESFLIFSGSISGASTGLAYHTVRGQLNSGSVQFSRVSTSGTYTANWFVVSNSGIFNVTNGTTTVTASTSVSIPSLNTSRSFRWQSHDTTGTGNTNANAMISSAITSSTTLALNKGTTSQTNVVNWQTIEIVDRIPPNGTLLTPINNTYTNQTALNLTVNATDNMDLGNATLNVYNSSGSLINTTTVLISGTQAIVGVVYEFLYDGIFHWFYRIFDSSGNAFNTENNTITIDTVSPSINFGTGTETNDTLFSRNWVYANVSVSDINPANLTFALYNGTSGTHLVNQTTYTGYSVTDINWTGLADGIYYYKASAADLANNRNSTETRKITLDTTPPSVFIKYPLNTTYNTNVSSLNYTYSDANPALCWYSTNNGLSNSSAIVAGTNFTGIVSSEGSNTWILYCNDSAGNLNFSSVTFFKDTIPPKIEFISDTLPNKTLTRHNWVYANVSLIELNFKNITYSIYNSSSIVNQTTYLTNVTSINWTNLPDGEYYYNVSVYDVANNYNFTETRNIILDTTAPNGTLLNPTNATYTNNTTQNLTANLTDNFNLSNATLNVYNSSGSLINTTTVLVSGTQAVVGVVYEFLYDGVFKWFYRIFDAAGNSFSTTNNTITIDTVNPNVQFVSPTLSNGDYYRQSYITENVSANDTNFANTTSYLYNSTGFVKSVANLTTIAFNNFTSLSDGVYYLNATTFDLANNKNSTETRTIVLDTTPPNVFIKYPLNITYNTNVSSLNYTYSDVNPALCWYSTNNGLSNSSAIVAGTNFTGITSIEGSNTWILYCNDSAGNLNFSSVTFFKDTISPKINFISNTLPNGSISRNSWIYVNVSITELNFKNATYTLYNSSSVVNQTTYTSPVTEINWTGLANGVYHYNVSVYDVANNYNSTETRTISLDTTPPTIFLNSPNDSIYTNSQSVDFNATVSDNVELSNVSIYLDNSLNQTNSSGINDSDYLFTISGISEGIHNWTIEACDVANNCINSSSRTFTVDLTNPLTYLIMPKNATYTNSSSLNFTINESDNLQLKNSTLYVWHNNGTLLSKNNFSLISGTSNQTNYTYTFVGDGIYKWNALTYDAAGNFAFNLSNYTFIVDTKAPEIQFKSPTPGNDSYKNQTYISVNVSVNDTNFANVTTYLYNSTGIVVDISNTTNNAFNNFTSLPEGIYYINATARDLAGNVNLTETRWVYLDITPPNASLLTPGNNTFTNNATQNLTFSANDSFGLSNAILNIFNSSGSLINTTNVLLSGTQVVTGVVYEFLYDGVFKWFYRIFDRAGNVKVTENNTITVDTTPPKVLLNSPANGTIISSPDVYLSSNFTELNNLSNVTLYVWNSTGSIVNITIVNISGSSNFTNLSVSLPYYDNYHWNYIACDFLDNCAFNSSNRTLIYEAQKVGLDLIYPISNITVAQNKFFNVTLNVTCLSGDCGSANVSLDPTNWWNPDWKYRKEINITNTNTTSLLPAGYTFNFTMNTSGNKFLSNGDDVRIIYVNGSKYIQLDRINITNFNSASTTIRFQVQKNISASGNDGNYYVYYGNPSAGVPPENKSNVYLFYDGMDSLSSWTTIAGSCTLSSAQGLPAPSLFTSGSGTTDKCYVNDFNLPKNFVLQASVYISGTSRGIRNINFRDDASNANGYMYRIQTSATDGGFFILNSGGTWSHIGPADGPYSANAWHNVTIQVNGNTFTAWVDGIQRASVTDSTYHNTKIGTQDDGGADQDSYVDNYLVMDYMNAGPSASLGGEQNSLKSGLVSTVVGNVPFYTNISNPYTTTSLTKGQSQVVNFWVNATGSGINTFFSFVNLTNNMSVSNKTISWNVTIDNIPPGITIASPLNQSYNVSNIDFNVSSNENLSMCNFTLNNWATNYSLQEFNSTYFYNPGFFVNDGIYTAKFWCEDLAGNVNNTQQISFVVDAFGANASLVNPANNTYTNDTTQNLTFSANDSVGLGNATLFVYNSSGSLINTTTVLLSGTQTIGGILYEFLYDGVFHWFYRIFDVGNHETNTENNTITVDTVVPLINFGSGTEINDTNISQNWVYANVSVSDINPANLTFALYNGTSGTHLVNQTTYTGYSVTDINWTGLADGIYYYKASAADLANNRNSTETRKIRLDTKAPVVKTKFPLNKSYGYNVTHLNYTVYDAGVGLDSCWYNINNTGNVSIACGQNVTTFLTDGVYTWNVYANDTLGHLGKANVTFTVNTQLPTVLIDYPNNITYNHSVTQLNFTAGGNLDTCWYSTNGGVTNHTTSCTQNITGLSSTEGLNDWRVYANNSVGGIAYDSVYFTVDTTPPLLTVISPVNDTYYPGDIGFNVSSNENINTCLFSIDDWATNYTMNPLNSTYFYYTQSVGPGVYNARFYCNDTVGNVNDTLVVPFNVSYPTILLNVTKPSSNANVLKYTKFNFSVNVTCLVSDCGQINVTLDPSSNWWNASWGYRQQINLSMPSGSTVKNYQEKIILNSSNVGSHFNWDYECVNSNSSRIRFVNQYQNATLPFWIQSCSVSGQSMTAWVKIPENITTSNYSIYLYYDNNNVKAQSNGTATFDYFDAGNLSLVNPWTLSNTAVGQDNTTGLPAPSYFAHSANGDYMYKNVSLTTNRVIDFNVRSDGLGNLFFLANSAGAGQIFRAETRSGDNTGLAASTSWTSWSAPTGCSNIATNTWYNFSLAIGSTTAQAYIDGAACGGSYSFTNNGPYIGLVGDALGATYTTWWDNLRVRKYSSVTPTYSVASEEKGSKGIISTTTGAQPFYAVKNPITTSALTKGQSEVINFTVNATGVPDVYTFFAFANLTKNMSVSNFSNYRNITILSNVAPLINITYPKNTTYNLNVDTLNYTYSATNPGLCWYSQNGGSSNSTAVNAGINFTGISTYEGINTFTLYCNNSDGIESSDSVTFFKDTIVPLISFATGTQPSNTTTFDNWIYANVSLTENNLKNITYSLYNSSAIINQTTYLTNVTSINWTNLPDGIYYYNVSVYDVANNYNFTETRNITVDAHAPNASLINPQNDTYSNNTNQNLTFSANDSVALNNATLFVFNSTGDLINTTTVLLSGTQAVGGIVYEFLYDGIFHWFYRIFDAAGHVNQTENRTITIDTVIPLINFGAGTENNDTLFSRNWVYANVTASDVNPANLTFYLYNGTGGSNLVNSTTYSGYSVTYINWTNLADGVYYYKVTAADLANNRNSTELRKISLSTQPPTVTLFSPANQTYNNDTIDINFTSTGTSNCWYSINGGFTNNTIPGCSNTTFVSPQGQHVFIIYVNNSFGLSNSTNTTYFVDSIAPQINYSTGTEANDTKFERNWIYINTTASDTNFANITFSLYNSTSLVDQATFSSAILNVNFTDLPSGNVTYYYNVTAEDILGNSNSTETRKIELIDLHAPFLNLVSPKNETYDTNTSIPLKYTFSDLNPESCWYNLDNSANVSITCGQNTTFDTSDFQLHTLYLYANDTLGQLNSTNVTFMVNTSAILTKYYQVQRGSFNLSNPADIILPRKLDKTKSFILLNTRSPLSEPAVLQVTANFTNSTDLGFYNYAWNSKFDYCRNITITNPGATLTNFPSYINLTNLTDMNPDLSDLRFTNSSCNGGGVPLDYQVDNYTSNHADIWVKTNLSSGSNIISVYYGNNTPVVSTQNSTAVWDKNYTAVWHLGENGTDTRVDSSINNHNALTSGYNGNESIPGIVGGADYVDGSNDFLDGQTNFMSNLGQFTVSGWIRPAAWGSRISFFGQNDAIEFFENGGTNSMMIWTSGGGSVTATYPYSLNTWHFLSAVGTGSGLTIYVDGVPIASGGSSTSNYGSSTYSAKIGGGVVDATGGYFTGAFDEVRMSNVARSADWLNQSYLMQSNQASYVSVGNQEPNLGQVSVEWEAVTGPEIGVQRGDEFYTSSSNSILVPISEVNLSSSFIIVQNRLNTSVSGNYNQGLWRSAFVNSTYIQLQRGTTGSSGTVNWQVVDWKNSTINNGTSSFSSSSSVINLANPALTDRSFLIFSGSESGSTAINSIFANAQLVNSTSIKISRAASTGTYIASYFVVSNDILRTRRGLSSISSSQNITIPEIYNVSKAFHITNQNVTGSSTLNSEGHVTGEITNSTNLLLQKAASVQTDGVSWQTIEFIERNPPVVDLYFPVNYENFSSYNVSEFNYTANDENPLVNCSLFANWTGSWGINQTVSSPANNTLNSFSGINTSGDGFYKWNVGCYDVYNNFGYNSTNYTFSTFLPPWIPKFQNASQTNNNGTGNVTISWNSANHALYYRIYGGDNLTDLVYLNRTNQTNYTDTNFSGHVRRFYLVSSVNPAAENFSDYYFGAHVYTLSHTASTKNWIAFPTNFSYIETANQTKDEIPNATSLTMWNATIQGAVVCNDFSCPSFPSCTSTNCNFNLQKGMGYEVGVNSSAPSSYNWSGVGVVYNMSNITLTKNSSSFGKNWISLGANTSLKNAYDMLNNITNADTVSRWNSALQTSQGYLYVSLPGWNYYVGTNFPTKMEEGYEVSVTTTENWTQI